jgi:hypothetical protein
MVPAMKATIVATAISLAAVSCGPGRTTFARYPGSAPTWDRAKQDPKAVEIADKVVAGAGGMDKWNTVKQLKWSEQVINDQKPVLEGDEAWDRWNARHYGKLMRSDGSLIVMRDLYGDSPGSVASEGATGGTRTKLPAADAAKIMPVVVDRFQFDTAVLCMPYLLEEPGTTLAFVGQAAGEGGKPLDVIKVTFDANDKARTGSAYQVDIDPETHTIARIEVVKAAGNIGYKVSGWTDVGGMKFPTQLDNIGYAGEVIKFKGIEVGEPQDSLYVETLH